VNITDKERNLNAHLENQMIDKAALRQESSPTRLLRSNEGGKNKYVALPAYSKTSQLITNHDKLLSTMVDRVYKIWRSVHIHLDDSQERSSACASLLGITHLTSQDTETYHKKSKKNPYTIRQHGLLI
jgi:hypothetical protein